MRMKKNFKAAVALVATGVLALSACGGDASGERRRAARPSR